MCPIRNLPSLTFYMLIGTGGGAKPPHPREEGVVGTWKRGGGALHHYGVLCLCSVFVPVHSSISLLINKQVIHREACTMSTRSSNIKIEVQSDTLGLITQMFIWKFIFPKAKRQQG